jgi:hypothetical protein
LLQNPTIPAHAYSVGYNSGKSRNVIVIGINCHSVINRSDNGPRKVFLILQSVAVIFWLSNWYQSTNVCSKKKMWSGDLVFAFVSVNILWRILIIYFIISNISKKWFYVGFTSDNIIWQHDPCIHLWTISIN